MPDASESAVPKTPSTVWHAMAAGACFVVSIAACLPGYLAFAAPGRWLDAPPSLEWKAQELIATRGSAQLASNRLIVAAPDAARTVVISVNTSFRARDYPVVAWDASGIPDKLAATLLWYSDINPSRVFRRPLVIEDARLQPTAVAQEPGWLGHIGGLALVLQGEFSEPIAVRGVAARPMSATQVLGDRLRGWLAFEPWTGASINGLTGGSDVQDLPLPLALAAVSVLAGLLYAALTRWRFRATGSQLGFGLVLILIAAWSISDARWQWNLLRQAQSTQAQYGGKSSEERHLVAEDGPLFGFIEQVRAKLPPPARVFMAADLPYFRYRGAYHLYPYDVYYDPSANTIPPPGTIHAGDYLVVYRRSGVQYDATAERLRWDGLAPVSAERLLTSEGAALFRIR